MKDLPSAKLPKLFHYLHNFDKNYMYTKCNYKFGYIGDVIFYQDDEKNLCVAKATELFFEEVLMKKNEHI